MDRDLFENDILLLGLGDDVSFSEVTSLAIRKFAADQPTDEVREQSLTVVEGMVRKGLARIGTLDERGAFVDRTHEVDHLLERVREVYDGSPKGAWRDVFWLRLTSEGEGCAGPVPEGYNPFDEDRRRGAGA